MFYRIEKQPNGLWQAMIGDPVTARFHICGYGPDESSAKADAIAKHRKAVPSVTHQHIARAVQRLNQRRGLTSQDAGYLMYADIRGDGTYRPSFYARMSGDGGGVVNVASLYRGANMRETLANVERSN